MSLKLSAEPMPRPPETTTRAELRSGRSERTVSRPRKLGEPGRVDRRHGRDLGAAALGRGRREGRGAHRDHPLGVGALHRRQRIAGVDVALERVGPEHRHDVAELGGVEQGRHARHARSCRSWSTAPADSRSWSATRPGSGRPAPRPPAARRPAPRPAAPCGRRRPWRPPRPRRRSPGRPPAGRPPAAAASAAVTACSVALSSVCVVVLGQDQDRHQSTPASSLSLATSSATEPTLAPACRLGGSSNLQVVQPRRRHRRRDPRA